MQTTSFRLRTNDELPAVGLGFWKVDKPRASDLVVDCIEVGYRHLDCACDYGNEAEVGHGIRRALDARMCRREELWVTSKLWNTYHAPEHVRAAIERSLNDLRLDYLDLYLVHFPIALRYVPFVDRYPPGWFFDPGAAHPKMEPVSISIRETWAAVEELQRAGLARNIGVCNFNCALLRDLLSCASIPPSVLQVEMHPHLTQEKLLRFCREQQIAVTAFSPFGSVSYVSLGMARDEDSLLQHPAVLKIAESHGRSAAQVLLRWGIQRGTAVIPKTSSRSRLAENLSVTDFSLRDDEMGAISGLNRNRRYNDPGDFCEAAFNTFFPIYD
jgi:D-xylose reductase